MRSLQWRILGAAAASVALGAPAWSQGRLEADVLRLYGGVYSPDCASPGAPRVRVLADALVVESGNRRLTGRELMAAHSYFGNSPPPGYLVALISNVPRGDGMLFIVYQDRAGQYLRIEADPKVRAALGHSLTGLRYRWCQAPAQQARPAAAPGQRPPAQAAQRMVNPWDLLRNPAFKSAYYRALGPKVNQDWLATLDGPAVPTTRRMVAGREYVYAMSCKNHDCFDNNTVLLYAADAGIVYGKVLQAGRGAFIGAPPPAVAAELERLWRAEFRQNR